MLSASDFPPGTIAGYTRASSVTVCLQDVSGRDVAFLGLAPVTVKYRDRCAVVTAYYLSNMPASVILGLGALERMDFGFILEEKQEIALNVLIKYMGGVL